MNIVSFAFDIVFMVLEISIPLPQRVFGFNHPPPPLEIPVLFHTFFFEIVAFEIPLPLGISNDPPRGGYGYFLDMFLLLQTFEIARQSLRMM